jgi:hypothetical protein
MATGGILLMAIEGQSDEEKVEDLAAPASNSETLNLRSRQALEEIRAGIVAHRGSLEGLLDEFLAERREEARREFGDESDSERD